MYVYLFIYCVILPPPPHPNLFRIDFRKGPIYLKRVQESIFAPQSYNYQCKYHIGKIRRRKPFVRENHSSEKTIRRRKSFVRENHSSEKTICRGKLFFGENYSSDSEKIICRRKPFVGENHLSEKIIRRGKLFFGGIICQGKLFVRGN